MTLFCAHSSPPGLEYWQTYKILKQYLLNEWMNLHYTLKSSLCEMVYFSSTKAEGITVFCI